jgi:sugar transferase (PEP-CTERM/EpsH1 system associated)
LFTVPRPHPLVAHVVYRFDTGGLENGVVNLINRMTDWRHAVIALTEVVPAFAARIQNPDVEFISLHKPPGHGWRLFPALARELRRLRPQVMHTRNLAALEMQLPAAWAGVPLRVHGEHGRDAHDVDGTVRRYQWVRRMHRPLVHRWVALSRDLADYLEHKVGVPPRRIAQIYNGVDQQRFAAPARRMAIADSPFAGDDLCLIGTVGRMQTVKAQPLLAQAFVRALQLRPALRATARLLLIGDGPLRAECEAVLAAGGCRDLAWLPGERSDVPALMQGMDLFVLPSLAEGISNTVLEAMACGLPVVATAVGGNADLVADGMSGQIVAAGDVEALARTLVDWSGDAPRRRQAGQAGRRIVEQRFSLTAMVDAYQAVYEGRAG